MHLPAEKEARLRQVATRTGKDAAQLVEEAVDRMLEYDTRFIEAVEEGRASARRGELLEHDEVVERVQANVPRLMQVRWTAKARGVAPPNRLCLALSMPENRAAIARERYEKANAATIVVALPRGCGSVCEAFENRRESARQCSVR